MLAYVLPSCARVESPAGRAPSPARGCLENQEMLSIPLLLPPITHAGKGSPPTEQGRGWQAPALVCRGGRSCPLTEFQPSTVLKVKMK